MPRRSFRADDRAIEGLPIRLVIAVVVGVASLGVMMSMLGPIHPPDGEELDVQPAPETLEESAQHDVTLTVVDTDGRPVSNATVVVMGKTATLDGVRTATTGPDGTATVAVSPTLGPNQQLGALEVRIKPPAGSQYTDDRANTGILVVRK